MDLIELGYQTVLVDLGIVKVAGAGAKVMGAGAKVMGAFKKRFGKGAPKPVAPPSATTVAGPTPPQNPAAGGLLAKIKRNPLKSVGIAGLGAGGLGYTMGQGAPPPDPAMQYYDQQQMGY